MFAICTLAQSQNPNLDAALAKSLGADEYGMKKYVFVVLKTGTYTPARTTERDSLFAGHMENINRLADIGKLVLAGPFSKNDDQFRGLFILNVATFEEANAYLSSDPAISSKMLQAHLYTWYGSAALPEYLKVDDKIWSKKH